MSEDCLQILINASNLILGISALSAGCRFSQRIAEDDSATTFRHNHSSFESAEKFRVHNILTPPGSVNQLQSAEEEGQMSKF